MNKLYTFLMFLLIVFVVMMSDTNAHAFGIGPYIELAVGSGSANVDYNYNNCPYDDCDEVDINSTGFGVVFDTSLSRTSVFNYRFSFGYSELDLPDRFDGIDAFRLSLDNTFGFGIVRKEKFRLWLGPQLHLSYSNWETPIGNSSYIEKEDISFLGLGVGAVLGANINLPKVISICPEIGVRYQWNISDQYEESCYGYGCNNNYYEEDYAYNEAVIFAKLSFMFGGSNR